MKTKISEWSTTPASNTDIDGINIAEGCAPSGINDAIRDLMAQVRSWQSGASGDPFNGPMNGTIGATTAYSGAFTTVSATGVITSTLATGTAPLTIASTTKVTNLNADLLDGADWASPAALGSTTPAAVSATTLSASGAVTLSGGTANGVTYLNGSKVLTSGSALTFNGTALINKPTSDVNPVVARFGVINSTATDDAYLDISADAANNLITLDSTGNNAGLLAFKLGGSEQMRLTSTGLGIGTSSPAAKLDVNGQAYISATSSQYALGLRYNNTTNGTLLGSPAANEFTVSSWGGTEYLRLNSTGLGIGTSSPSAKLQVGWTNDQLRFTNPSGGVKRIGASYTGYVSGNDYAAIDLGTSGSSGGNLLFKVTPSGGSLTTAATLDEAGNLGLGVTPSAWGVNTRALQMGDYAALNSDTANGAANLSMNAYYNGTNWIYRNSSWPASYYSQINGQHRWFNAPSSGAGGAGTTATFTQAMTLDASGHLNIGITSGSSDTVLYANESANATRYVVMANGNTGSSAAAVFNASAGSGGDGRLWAYGINHSTQANNVALYNHNGSGSLLLGTVGTERARIDSSGNFVVGYTAAGAYDTNSFSYAPSSIKGIDLNHATGTTTGTNYARFNYAGSTIGSITQSGTSAVLYNVTSDQRLKENIQDADSASSLIDSLQVRKFDWKADGSHQRYGFVAQELVTVAPEAVHQPADDEQMMAVDYSKLVPMLVKEIQSLRQRVAQLETN